MNVPECPCIRVHELAVLIANAVVEQNRLLLREPGPEATDGARVQWRSAFNAVNRTLIAWRKDYVAEKERAAARRPQHDKAGG